MRSYANGSPAGTLALRTPSSPAPSSARSSRSAGSLSSREVPNKTTSAAGPAPARWRMSRSSGKRASTGLASTSNEPAICHSEKQITRVVTAITADRSMGRGRGRCRFTSELEVKKRRPLVRREELNDHRGRGQRRAANRGGQPPCRALELGRLEAMAGKGDAENRQQCGVHGARHR